MNRFGGFKYCVEETKDGRVHFLFNEEYPNEMDFTIDDHSVFDSLQQVILKHNMDKYSGQYKPMMQVLDGQSWSLYVKYASGASISAGGYEAGPDGYWAAFDDIRACLDPWKDTPVAVNRVVSFDYSYVTTHFHIEPQGDHTLVTIDDESTGRHEVIEKPLEMLEDLRVITITEDLRDNGKLLSDHPDSKPFKFDIVFTNGNHYVYESYDSNYRCHKTEVMYWFFERWEIDFKLTE